MQCIKCTLILALLLIPEPTPAIKGDIVKTWATNLGEELWKLSESLTKSHQIRIKYKQMNASVKKKDGKSILESSLRSVSTMLKRKINAVKCIHATAEELAKQFTYEAAKSPDFPFQYCSAKYSEFSFQYPEDEVTSKIDPPSFLKESRAKNHYLNVSLEKDSHFYNISVNTNMSCVHVPTNIYYEEKNAKNAISWSEGLDDVFLKNYNSDPSLVWQYFGSAHGVLRFFPGMPWNRKHADIYDCRVQSWYIEAATCSKDVIILFDISGSMTGFKNYVARRTLSSLLDTLSNNDYVNVFHFKNVTGKAVECFDNLVQATKENINTIKDALEPTDEGKKHKYPLEGCANLTQAYIKAFDVLREVREKRSTCDTTSTQGCNQLVMVITDYVPGNLSEVFDEHNREVIDNRTYIPVRVFTYLIGKEVTNVREIQEMACSNRGYFVHIHSVEEVQQQVLKYINVIARPMILAGDIPLPTWTHANIDNTRLKHWNVSNDIDNPDEDKLVTSVAIPAFDYYTNEKEKSAMLLGVAGTDVPIDSISKLAQPHQLGVNGYSFIVSNNGYLLLHPLLVITINDQLLDNYNSVDFVEVEQVDDGKGPRELGKEIQELREHLVYGHDGEMRDIKVLYHYDQMRRIARVRHDYFFHDLHETPFSMGISLPKKYGDTELLLKDNPLEAKQGKALTGINVTDYFRYTYRVHPDWVYCKYHYLEGHENVHPEHEIFKFLGDLSRNKLNISKKQYEFKADKHDIFNISTHCGEALERESRDADDYYCNEDLVKQLVFDAKLTTPYFEKWHASEQEWALAREYNVSVRFVATSSGLTRWHYIDDDDKNEKVLDDGMRAKKFKDKVFGDYYLRSIEETWYKAAVLQHSNNDNVESLVIATKLPILDEIIQNKPKVKNEDGDITITASYAVFYKDGDSETPASVLGFEFLYSSFYERFKKITESVKDWGEGISCTDSKHECYVIDSSGYIVLSREKDHVGRFFGVINPYVLTSLVNHGKFDFVEVFNYQALCPWWMRPDMSSGNFLLTPFTLMKNVLAWLFTEIVIMTTNLYSWSENAYANDIDDKDYFDTYQQAHTEPPTTAKPPPARNKTKDKDDKPFSCDHSVTLYILNQTYFLDGAETGAIPLVYEQADDCNPTYWATLITKTNLLLVVVENTNRTFPKDCELAKDTTPVATVESKKMREPCHKLPLGNLPRKKLEGCFTYHDREKNITDCGLGHNIRADTAVFTTAALLALATTNLFL